MPLAGGPRGSPFGSLNIINNHPRSIKQPGNECTQESSYGDGCIYTSRRCAGVSIWALGHVAAVQVTEYTAAPIFVCAAPSVCTEHGERHPIAAPQAIITRLISGIEFLWGCGSCLSLALRKMPRVVETSIELRHPIGVPANSGACWQRGVYGAHRPGAKEVGDTVEVGIQHSIDIHDQSRRSPL